MALTRQPFRRASAGRGRRAGLGRCVLAVVMIPVLLIGSLGGVRLYAHAHDDHYHIHAADRHTAAALDPDGHGRRHDGAPSCHVHNHESHGHGPHGDNEREDGWRSVADQEGSGFHITIPDHERLLGRALADVTEAFSFAQLVRTIEDCWPPRQLVCMGAADGPRPTLPRDLCARSSGERLVRTSQAMLI